MRDALPIAPTLQPLPGGVVFTDVGQPVSSDPIEVKTKTYVDTDGIEVPVQVAAQRKDGSFDILIPNGNLVYRRDGVRLKQSDDQTGDYLK